MILRVFIIIFSLFFYPKITVAEWCCGCGGVSEETGGSCTSTCRNHGQFSENKSCVGITYSEENGWSALCATWPQIHTNCANSTDGSEHNPCDAGYEVIDGECVEEQTPPEGEVLTQGLIPLPGCNDSDSVGQLGSVPAYGCFDGTEAVFTGSGSPSFSSLNNGTEQCYAAGEYRSTGNPCQEGLAEITQPLTDIPPNSCPEGETLQNINGNIFCFDPEFGTATSDPVSEDGENIPGLGGSLGPTDGNPVTESAPGGPGSENPGSGGFDGEGTTGTGAQVAVDPGASSGDPFCDVQPDSPICQVSEYGGAGNCGAPPYCAGDAIQCAQAYELWKRNCAEEAKRQKEETVAQQWQSKSKGQIEREITGSNQTLEQWSEAQADNETNVMDAIVNELVVPDISATCPANPEYNIAGAIFVFPYNVLCDWAETWMSPIVMLIAWLSVFQIVYTGVREI